ncbi:hypothetical protein D3C78_1561430 [compost metagenome]
MLNAKTIAQHSVSRFLLSVPMVIAEIVTMADSVPLKNSLSVRPNAWKNDPLDEDIIWAGIDSASIFISGATEDH